MMQRPESVEAIVMVCCILHNLMLTRYPNNLGGCGPDAEDQDTHQVIPGTWRDNEALLGLQAMGRNTMSTAGKHQRNYLMSYYNSPVGSVAWQQDMI